MDAPCRVLVVEDEPWLCHEVIAALHGSEPPLCVVATAETARDAVAQIKGGLAFDVALVDLGLPDAPGSQVIRAIRAAHPAAVVVAFTVFDEPGTVLGAIQAGAHGYLLKTTPLKELGAALTQAVAGGAPMSPCVARLVVDRLSKHLVAPPDLGHPLTARETETLTLLAQGHTYQDIATVLGIRLGTVQSHVKSIYGKLEIASKAEAALVATRLGLA